MTVMTNSAKNNGNPFGAVDYAMHKEDILATGITVKEYEGGISYQKDSQTASVLKDDEADLYAEDVSMMGKWQHFAIQKVNPFLRFLF